ncbi:MAG TPA: 30S ribosomal protein S6 [Deinococcales bacterium]|nr:30S ribosomal protein S6 [Deinococcales bacterium]
MALYDLNVILNPSLDADQLQTEKNYIENAVKNGGGNIEGVDEWGNRRLAYSIKREREGYYLIYRVTLGEDRTNDIQATLRLRDNVRRVMVVRQRPEWRTKKAS